MSWTMQLPGQVRSDGTTRPTPFAASRRGEAQHVLRSVVTQILSVKPAEHHAVRSEEAGRLDLVGVGPARRAIGLGIAASRARQTDMPMATAMETKPPETAIRAPSKKMRGA